METLTVGAAIIEHKHRYLVVRRAAHKENADMWEFPGGKLNPGESLQQCVEREISEELGVSCEATKLLGSCEGVVSGKGIRLFAVQTVLEREPSQSKDHSELRWVSFEELARLPMTVVDLGLLHSLQGRASKEMELSHLDWVSFFKVYSIINGIIGIFVGAFILMVPGYLPSEVTFIHRILVALLTPLGHVLIGGFFGIAVALAYNFLASSFGGFKMRFR